MRGGVLLFGGILLFCIVENGWSAEGEDGGVHELEPVFTKPLDYMGDRLIIGSMHSKSMRDVFPDMINIAKEDIGCTRLPSNEFYKSDYVTKIRKRSSTSYEVLTDEENQQVQVTDYFVQVAAEVWFCDPLEVHRYPRDYKFFKIVNGMINIKRISEIKYYSGVEVSMIDCVYYDCVKVVETKCLKLDEENENIVTQFKCEKWTDFPPKNISIPNLEEQILSFEPELIDTQYYMDRGVATIETKEISSKGKSLMIGLPPLNKATKKFLCQPLVLGTEIFLPECYQVIDIGGSRKNYAKLTPSNFRELFRIVGRDIQYCVSETDSKEVIFRVKYTVIGHSDIQNIEYGDGIVELYSIHLPDDRKTIRYTEVRYFDATTRKPVDWKVQFKEMRGKRHASYFVTDESKFDDIVYKLSPTTIFSTFISPVGYNLQVGSIPLSAITTKQLVWCNKIKYLDEFKMEIKLKISEGSNYAMVSDDRMIMPKYISQESWMCRNRSSSENSELIRVANRLKFLIPVHSIDSFDGVEIMLKPSNEDKHSTYVEIFEVKYLRYGKAVRYEGRWTLETIEKIDTGFSISQDQYAISKNEIHPRFINRVPKRKHNMKDYYWDGNYYEKFVIEEGRSEIIKFSINTIKNREMFNSKQPYLFVCQKADNVHEFTSYFDILRGGVKATDSFQDSELSSKYFENVVKKNWLCVSSQDSSDNKDKNKNKDKKKGKDGKSKHLQLYRVKTKQDFKRDGQEKISEIQHASMDKVWFGMLGDNENYALKFKGIRYYNTITGELQDFGAYYLIMEDEPRSGKWRSGMQELEQYSEKSKVALSTDEDAKDYYSMNTERTYRLVLNEESTSKLTMKIGSKWERMHGDRYSKIKCAEDASVNDTTRDNDSFRTQVSFEEDGKKVDVDTQYLELKRRKVWNCTDEQTKEEIIRVRSSYQIEKTQIQKVKDILYYYDGIAVLSGVYIFEIVEVKYIDASSKEVVQFEGELEKIWVPTYKEEEPLLLQYPAVIDTEYTLNEDEVFKTIVGKSGYTLEIGERTTSPSESISEKSPTTMNMTFECVRVDPSTEKGLKYSMKPKVVILTNSGNSKRGSVPVIMTEGELNKLLNSDLSHTFFWKCTERTRRLDERIFYRVMSQMDLKAEFPIYQIYHYDGVTIFNHDKRTVIQQIKYLITDTTPVGFQTLKEYKFEGFLTLPEKDMPDRLMDTAIVLHKQTVCAANLNAFGDTVEIVSKWDEVVESDVGDIVKCMRNSDNPYLMNPHHGTTMKMNLPPNVKSGSQGTWQEKSVNDYFEFVTQEEWECQKNETYIFSRTVNKLITMKTDTRVYYPAGVEVGTLLLPNKEKALQVTQVKFVKSKGQGTFSTIRYVGKLRLVTETLVGAEKFLASFHLNKEPRTMYSEPKAELKWTFDSMRMLARRKLDTLTTDASPVVTFTDEKVLYTKLVDSEGDRMFQVGRFWEQIIKLTEGDVKCFHFGWCKGCIPKYTPRVAQYMDKQLYTLTENEFNEVFKIIESKVWLCTNGYDEFFKVQTVYETKASIFAVRYTDGVEVEIKTKGGTTVKITETVYMDTMASKVLRHDEGLKQVQVRQNRQTTGIMGELGNTFKSRLSGSNNK